MNQKDICDIIIENITKDWNNSMNTKTQTSQWEVPKYSKSEINKAGTIIANTTSSKEDREKALSILNNWRAAHAYPLQVICSNLRLNNPDAIVVQRLKRLESITNKIKRFPNMNLYRMQDLGGCRVIVDTIEQVYEAVNKYKKSRIRHKFKKEDDYIQTPKKSGYRSYHMVYQFQSDKKETYNKNMLIEIQFRTKLQHTWATAVEMMGIYTKSNLKSSQGNEDILRFFTLVSSLFAIKEHVPICPDTSNNIYDLIEEINYINERYHIISTLSYLNLVIDYTSKKINNKNIYYMVVLDYSLMKVNVHEFKSSQLEIAMKAYEQIEKDFTKKNVVLTSANSFNALREAYPNYFADISGFIIMLRDIFRKYEEAKHDLLI